MKSGVAVVLALLALLTACSGDTEVAPPTPTTTTAREADARQVVGDLARALEERDPDKAAVLGIPEAEPLLRAVVQNAVALDLELRGLRYLEDGTPAAEDLTGSPAGTWAAIVELSWRLPGWDPRDSRVETAVLLAPHGGRHRIVGFAPGTDRVPLWLAAPLEVRRTPRVLVLNAGEGSPRILDLGRQAVAEVTETLGWRGKLVIEAPASERQLEDALLAGDGKYRSIAAVTTPVDGSAGAEAPVHVFLNPSVFSRLGDQGAQVVMTHETVHVATDATASSAPIWLREGFADQVALAHADVPVQKAAAQAIAGVRKDGPPTELPSDADLSATAPGLGAAYEEAWLVCRFIAREYGEDRLVRFYDAVDDGTGLSVALREVLGTTEADLTKAWSQDLARLAG